MSKLENDNYVHAGQRFTSNGYTLGNGQGKNMRDEFAGIALGGILAGNFGDTVPHDDIDAGPTVAHFAYIYADAMLAERDK
jgi:hypothetical protein